MGTFKFLWSGLVLYHIEIARKELGNQDLHEYYSLLQPIFYAFYYKNTTHYWDLFISILLFQLRHLLYSLYAIYDTLHILIVGFEVLPHMSYINCFLEFNLVDLLNLKLVFIKLCSHQVNLNII